MGSVTIDMSVEGLGVELQMFLDKVSRLSPHMDEKAIQKCIRASKKALDGIFSVVVRDIGPRQTFDSDADSKGGAGEPAFNVRCNGVHGDSMKNVSSARSRTLSARDSPISRVDVASSSTSSRSPTLGGRGNGAAPPRNNDSRASPRSGRKHSNSNFAQMSMMNGTKGSHRCEFLSSLRAQIAGVLGSRRESTAALFRRFAEIGSAYVTASELEQAVRYYGVRCTVLDVVEALALDRKEQPGSLSLAEFSEVRDGKNPFEVRAKPKPSTPTNRTLSGAFGVGGHYSESGAIYH